MPWSLTGKTRKVFQHEVALREMKKTNLPEFTCATCRLANEDDNGEDLRALQPAHAVEA